MLYNVVLNFCHTSARINHRYTSDPIPEITATFSGATPISAIALWSDARKKWSAAGNFDGSESYLFSLMEPTEEFLLVEEGARPRERQTEESLGHRL